MLEIEIRAQRNTESYREPATSVAFMSSRYTFNVHMCSGIGIIPTYVLDLLGRGDSPGTLGNHNTWTNSTSSSKGLV